MLNLQDFDFVLFLFRFIIFIYLFILFFFFMGSPKRTCLVFWSLNLCVVFFALDDCFLGLPVTGLKANDDSVKETKGGIQY